jgi:nicotinamide mononucleotide transporter
MNNLINELLQGLRATTYWEFQAIVAGILYLVFAIKEKKICWFFALVNAATYVYVSYTAKLHLDALLQIFYIVMAVVGYLNWNKEKDILHIHTWTATLHLFTLLFTSLVSVLVGYLFHKYTDQANPYLDAFATCFSLVTTYMVTRKVLENWIYWIVIDSLMIYLYFVRDLKMSSLLMTFYTIMAINGFLVWRKIYRQQKNAIS